MEKIEKCYYSKTDAFTKADCDCGPGCPEYGMTEKRTAEEIPSSLIELLHAHSINTEFVAAANKMYVTSAPLPYFEAACKMYAAQELDAYKTKLKELLLKRKQEHHKDCLTDAFINGRFWECQELLELIDKL